MFEKLLSLFKKDIQVEPKVEPEISFEQFNNIETYPVNNKNENNGTLIGYDYFKKNNEPIPVQNKKLKHINDLLLGKYKG